MSDGEYTADQTNYAVNNEAVRSADDNRLIIAISSDNHWCDKLRIELEGEGHDVKLVFKRDIITTSADLMLIDVSDMEIHDITSLLAKSSRHKRVGLINVSHEHCSDLVERFGSICGVFCGTPKFTEVVQGTKAMLDGDQWLPRSSMSGSIARYRGMVESARVADKLSAREMQVMVLAAYGMTSKEIGKSLGLKTSTIKNHIHNSLSKLGASNRAQGAAMCLAHPDAEKYIDA
jgi:DNA-binding NarL/FixJ family response regulator